MAPVNRACWESSLCSHRPANTISLPMDGSPPYGDGGWGGAATSRSALKKPGGLCKRLLGRRGRRDPRDVNVDPLGGNELCAPPGASDFKPKPHRSERRPGSPPLYAVFIPIARLPGQTADVAPRGQLSVPEHRPTISVSNDAAAEGPVICGPRDLWRQRALRLIPSLQDRVRVLHKHDARALLSLQKANKTLCSSRD